MQRTPLEEIIINEEFSTRPIRVPRYDLENKAMRDIMRQLSVSPKAALQALVEYACKLTGAESAGVSIAEAEDNQEIFRWHAVTGKLSHCLNATMPRDFSPCGETTRRRVTLIMRDLVRHYPYVESLGVYLHEGMLVPFFQNGEPVGTIWIVSHSKNLVFNPEDRRVLESLAEFTSGIVQSYANARKLEETLQQRDRFVEALTHDMRTPLSAAKLSAQVLEKKRKILQNSETFERMISQIIRSVERVDRMIQNVLDVNRVSAGVGLPISPVECRLDELVAETVQELSSLYGPRFEVVNETGAITGQWDPQGIQRIIENLSSNAVKYGSPDRPVMIKVHQEMDYAEISVHNDGEPIAEQDQQRLFDRYRRGQDAVASGAKGWGVGLTLVKGLTEAHDGSVRIQSSPERGTTFSVRFPIKISPTAS